MNDIARALRGATIYLKIIVLLCVTTGAGACHRPRSTSNVTVSSTEAALPSASPTYPRGRWRLAPFSELNQTALWVSHIVIRYAGSDATPFRVIGWSPDPEAPARSQEEALERAATVADLARKSPGTFSHLAATYSDDVVTKDRGGSLGGVRAGQLPEEYLDALADMKPGKHRASCTRLSATM